MATHSSILTWKISWTEEPGGTVRGLVKELDTTEQLIHKLTPKDRNCQTIFKKQDPV